MLPAENNGIQNKYIPNAKQDEPDFVSPEESEESNRPSRALTIKATDAQLSTSSRPTLQGFLRLFPESIFCYLEDEEGRPKDLPPFHDSVLDFSKSEQGYGLFISVNGFKNTKSRAGTNLSSLQHLYVDIDAPKAILSDKGLKDFKNTALKALHEIDGICPLSILVETKRGFHAYWRISPLIRSVEDDETRNVYLELLDDIRSRLRGDDGAKDTTRVLRVPFTKHQKDPRSPFQIKLLVIRPDQAMSLWEYKAILLKDDEAIASVLETAARLPPIDNKNRPDAKSPVSPEEEPLVFELAGVAREIIPENIKRLAFEEAKLEVQRQYPKHERPSFQTLANPNGTAPGARNSSLHICASILREGGSTEAQTLSRFPSYNGLSPREIQSVIKHAYKRSQGYEYAWNHPIYAAAVTEEEKKKIRTLTSAFMSRKLSSYLIAKRDARERTDTAEKLEQAGVEAMKKQTTIASTMTRAEQREHFDILEALFLKQHPNLRAVDGSYFIERNENNLWRFVSNDELYGRIVNYMWDIGILGLRSNSNVTSKVKSLIHFPSIQIASSAINSPDNIRERLKSDGPFIPTKNGLLDVSTLSLHPYGDDCIFLSPIDAEWLPESVSETDKKTVQDFLFSVSQGEEKKVELLKTVIGYTLLNDCRFHRAFVLLGGGANGKSTFLKMISSMIGADNTLPFQLEKLSNNFFAYLVLGKRLGIVEEVSSNYFESDMFKKLVSGETIEADRKYQSAISFKPFMKIMIAVNEMPKVNDTQKGFYRRVEIIPFNAAFDGEKADPLLEYKLHSARNATLLLAVEGLRSLLAAGGFTKTEEMEKQLNAYRVQNSTALSFLQEYMVSVPHEPRAAYETSARDALNLYQEYGRYCREAGFRQKAVTSFIAELRGLQHPDWPTVSIRTVSGKSFVLGTRPRAGPDHFQNTY